MKKYFSLPLILLLVALSGCNANNESSETRFVFDTVATITADCDDDIIDGAFSVCSDYEKLLSRTVDTSEVSLLNKSEGFLEISDDTRLIIEKSLVFSEISGGKFDITIYPLSSIWDFRNQIVPERNEIAEALKNVDYESIEIDGNRVNLNGKKIDLGGIAKGFIADKVKEYLTANGVENGIINLGGNVIVFGSEQKVGIKRPFSEDELALTLCLKDRSIVTSGIYERYIEKDGKLYHHILDKTTGYGIENSLASVTIIGKSSLDCDAFSTVCILEGLENGKKLIEKTADTEAVFITKDGEIILTDGLYKKNNTVFLK